MLDEGLQLMLWRCQGCTEVTRSGSVVVRDCGLVLWAAAGWFGDGGDCVEGVWW